MFRPFLNNFTVEVVYQHELKALSWSINVTHGVNLVAYATRSGTPAGSAAACITGAGPVEAPSVM